MSTALTAGGLAHDALANTGSSAAALAGDEALAGAASKAALPLSVALTVGSETAAGVSDYNNGMSLTNSLTIHGLGAAGGVGGGWGGAVAGFAIGEAIFPAGGGLVGAVVLGAGGSIGGGWLGHAAGNAIVGGSCP